MKKIKAAIILIGIVAAFVSVWMLFKATEGNVAKGNEAYVPIKILSSDRHPDSWGGRGAIVNSNPNKPAKESSRDQISDENNDDYVPTTIDNKPQLNPN
jgi:hypothetical protein